MFGAFHIFLIFVLFAQFEAPIHLNEFHIPLGRGETERERERDARCWGVRTIPTRLKNMGAIEKGLALVKILSLSSAPQDQQFKILQKTTFYKGKRNKLMMDGSRSAQSRRSPISA